MVPYREWRLFDTRSLKGYGGMTFATYDLWTVDHLENGKIGIKQISGSPNYIQERYDLIIRPTSDFNLLAGMDSPVDAVFEFSLCLQGKHIHSRGTDTILGVHLDLYDLDDPDGLAWDKRLVTGRHYNGEDQWDDYPHDRSVAYFTDPNSSYGGYGYGYASWGTLGIFYHTAMGAQPYASSNAIFFDGRENFFKGGLSFRINNGFSLSGSVEVPETTEYWYFVLNPIRLNIHYFNPVVNSISRKWMPTTGGVELKLNGIAFDLTDAELSDATRHPTPGTPVGGWNHVVEYIYFEGLQNQGQYKLQRSALDFIVDSDSQITIPANKMPAMAAGTYAIRLKTWNIADVGPVVSWAGDWKAAADGRVSRSGRLIFRVGLPTVKASGMPLFGQYAPIDIRVKSAANLVLNGGFNADASEWTASGGGGKPAMASVAGGFSGNCLQLTCDGTPGRYAYEKIDGLVIGEHYRIQGYFKKGTASGGFIKLGTTQGGGEIFSQINLADAAWALYGANFLATAGSAYVSLGVEEANKTALFDEIWLFQGPGFYEGRLLSQSPVKRALDDNAGSGTISDMDLELANGDRFFSQQLATEFLKNQVIQTFQAWQEAAESEKSLVFTGSIDDYELEGDLFRMKVRDVTQTHFQKKIPVGICTSEEFPDIHPDEDGKPMPDILGRANFTTTEAKGAVRAIYIDTTIYRYLAARGSLHGVTEVYSDGTLMTLTTHYSIINDDLGRTYIQFLADQGEKKITFNAEGYVCTPMNSANGYVQNPAYIRLFFLNYLMELPSIFIDFESFDTLAAFYTAIGEHESGYLILQEEREAREVLAELSFTYGDTGFINKAGQYAVGRKGLKDITTEAFLFNQIDLIGHPKWKFNLNDAINYLKARFNYYPDPAIYKQAIKQTYVASRDKFGADVGEEIEMPWTTSATLISRRLAEELLRRGYGDKKCEFSVAIQWIDDLDLFTNIRLQDPFAIDAAGAGETGHYLYIEEMTVDQAANRIDIVAADYQWLLRQYCLLGDRDDLADNWATADESDRMWCYLCNRTTGYFADGEPGKVLADRNTF